MGSMPLSGDRLLALLGTLVVLLGVVFGAAVGLETRKATAAPSPSDPAGDAVLPVGRSPQARLPKGVRIDPETLEITGLDLAHEEGVVPLAWTTLRAYEYRAGLAGLPADLRALDGTRVAMAGFLLPLYEWEDIREFNLVASHWSCCFGVPPGITGWVHVTLAPGPAGLGNTTEPLEVSGTFRVREQQEAGYVVAIWAIEDATAHVIGW